METFKIEVMETLSRIVEVKAENLDKAVSLIHQQYREQIIILDHNDHVTTEINPYVD